MNENKELHLQQVLISQTWNKTVSKTIVEAISDNKKSFGERKTPSPLQLALQNERKKNIKIVSDSTFASED